MKIPMQKETEQQALTRIADALEKIAAVVCNPMIVTDAQLPPGWKPEPGKIMPIDTARDRTWP